MSPTSPGGSQSRQDESSVFNRLVLIAGFVYVLVVFAVLLLLVPLTSWAGAWIVGIPTGIAAFIAMQRARIPKKTDQSNSRTTIRGYGFRGYGLPALFVALFWIALILIWRMLLPAGAWWMLVMLVAAVLGAAVLYWLQRPTAYGRVLGGVTVGALLLSTFLLRMWLTINVFDAVHESGVATHSAGPFQVQVPQRVFVGKEAAPIQISLAPAAMPTQPIAATSPVSPTATVTPAQPITVEFTVNPAGALQVVPSVRVIPADPALRPSTVYTATVTHNMRKIVSCDDPSGFWQSVALWVDILFTDKCSWVQADVTYTFPPDVGATDTLAKVELEGLHRGQLRHFVESTSAVDSPLLLFVPSLLAVIAYAANQHYTREQKQEVEREQEKLRQQFTDAIGKSDREMAFKTWETLEAKRDRWVLGRQVWERLQTWHDILAAPNFDSSVQARLADCYQANPKTTCHALALRPEECWQDEYLVAINKLMQFASDFFPETFRTRYLEESRKSEAVPTDPYRPLSDPAEKPKNWPSVIATSRKHVFSGKTKSLNPFVCYQAEQEPDQQNAWFCWADHSLFGKLARSSGSSCVVVGERGSGKTALAFYQRRELQRGDSPQSVTLAVNLPALLNSRSMAVAVAEDALQLTAPNIAYLSTSRESRRLLIEFLAATLGSMRLIGTLASVQDPAHQWPTSLAAGRARAVHMDFMADARALSTATNPAPSGHWLHQFGAIADALQTKGCHLLIDNVNDVLTPAQLEMLQLLRCHRTVLTVFTRNHACADELEDAGFARLTLSWSPEELQKLACHRLNAADVNDLAERLDPERLQGAFFEDDAWEQFWPGLYTPRRLFKALTYFIECLSEGQKIKKTDVDAALPTL